ncbi:MAG: RDD family protein [Kibdelosporangium sp.]
MAATHRADREFAEIGELGRVPLATYGGRFAARVVDFLIIYVPAYFPMLLFGPEGLFGQAVVLLVLMVLYDLFLMANTGATPGKRIARIKVVRAGDGRPPGWWRTFVRAVVLAVPGWIINAIVALFDERRHRGVHDSAADTLVIAV